jgi:hypothetical protein
LLPFGEFSSSLQNEPIGKFEKENIVTLFPKVKRVFVVTWNRIIKCPVSFSRPDNKQRGARDVFPTDNHIGSKLTKIEVRFPEGVIGGPVIVLIHKIPVIAQ